MRRRGRQRSQGAALPSHKFHMSHKAHKAHTKKIGEMMNKELICIACPMGCHLTVAGESPDFLCVTGNKCAKGAKYGIEEATNPKRVVTYVVRSNSESLPFVPVRTDDALPKALIPELIADLNQLRVNTPLRRGDVIVANFADTGVNVVATRSHSADTPSGDL